MGDIMNKDIYYMNIALNEAKKAAKNGDIPIGCVIVKDNKIVSKAFNKREKNKNVINHAEIIAIKKACRKLKTWHLNNCIAYITMEPCMMCSGALIQSRIKKIVYSIPNENFGQIENNYKVFENNKIEILKNIEYEKSKKIVQDFFEKLR